MDIKRLIDEIDSELKSEERAALPKDKQVLHEVAQRLLVLERDLKAPGASRSQDERVLRLLEAIAKETF